MGKIFILIVAFIYIGCTPNIKEEDKDLRYPMVIGERLIVEEGDSVEPVGNGIIEITHLRSSGLKSVVLIQGEAYYLKGGL
ncbi:MAG: hypothetical protein OIF32_08140 [Campylobacterales bacterium]|nr:hypothetical protein [Campylobacterales bacterium]